MSATDTIPAQTEVLSVETVALVADLSAQLGQGETVLTASVELIQIDTGTRYAAGLQGAASVSAGNLVTQVITGLVPGKKYRLLWSGNVAANKTIGAKTTLVCPA